MHLFVNPFSGPRRRGAQTAATATRLLEAVGSHTPADFNPVSPPRRPRSAVGRAAAACVWYVGPCLILLFGFALTVLGLLDAVKSVAEGEAVCVHHHNHTS